MVQFDPNTLYSIKELEGMLGEMVKTRTFLDRLGLKEKRLFKKVVWGWEIIDASHEAEKLSAVGRNQVVAFPITMVSKGNQVTVSGGKGVRKLTTADLD